MTKKDFELFADEIFSSASGQKVSEVKYTVELCKRVFKRDNTAFNADKFERACFEGKHIRSSIRSK